LNAWFNRRPDAPASDVANAPLQPSPASGFRHQLTCPGEPVRTAPKRLSGVGPLGIEAAFQGGIRARVQEEQGARWLLWVSDGGRWMRRKDSASPSVEHACRIAEHWFGSPIDKWNHFDNK
jgi:hypothetical protein